MLQYVLVLEDGDQFLMAGQKRKSSTRGSDYTITVSWYLFVVGTFPLGVAIDCMTAHVAFVQGLTHMHVSCRLTAMTSQLVGATCVESYGPTSLGLSLCAMMMLRSLDQVRRCACALKACF